MEPNVDSLNVFQRLQLAWYLMRDDRVSPWVKKAGPAVLLAYVISPIDLIPDFLIGPGQVDDLGVLAVGLVVLVRMLVRFAPDDVVAEYLGTITGTRGRRARQDRDTIETRGRVRS
jgi:uncharacterized membrane protein YkvA (DUF1232 family)